MRSRIDSPTPTAAPGTQPATQMARLREDGPFTRIAEHLQVVTTPLQDSPGAPHLLHRSVLHVILRIVRQAADETVAARAVDCLEDLV